MITITGLTERQRMIMDLLWNCEDLDAVNDIIDGLPTEQDKRDARALVIVATQETIEHELGLDKYAPLARDILDRFR